VSKTIKTKNGLLFEESEVRFLIACRYVQVRRKLTPDAAKVEENIRKIDNQGAVDISKALAQIRDRGLLKETTDGGFFLNEDGLDLAREIHTRKEQEDFGQWMTKAENSSAYVQFCRKVYGTDFVQFGMLDEEQLQKLISILDLKESDRVLDLGCGIGSQAEYLRDHSTALIVGLDFSEKAISRAAERTRNKSDRLKFVYGNFDELDNTIGRFHVILAIDTLYFAEDLKKTIRDCLALLTEGGRLVAFYSQKRKENEPRGVLAPGNTKLGVVLSESGVEYHTLDFTENDRRLWKRQLAVASELKSAFESEGNIELWQGCDSESREILRYIEDDSWRRYLYIATV
jgi:2-polyprenyl-3-methyl-5-hydroxy-6-metoxy-1,4-benzoquinol methylase